MEFTFRLTGPGWAEARIANGDSWAGLTASYLGDALGELLSAVVDLTSGALETRCSWEEEPGEFRWEFNSVDQSVSLTVTTFDFDDEKRPDGRVIFATTVLLDDLVRAVTLGARAVLDCHTEQGYRQLWVQPFPTAQLSSLENWIKHRRELTES